jgi:hypothetical protein
MKIIFWINQVILAVIMLFLTTGCKKDETVKLPELTANTVTNVTATEAVIEGYIISDGGSKIIASGVCWSTRDYPTTEDSKIFYGTGTGQFVCTITGLTAGTTYYARAFATNSLGTAYGDDLSFSTSGLSPSCITQQASNVSETGATLNGIVIANGLYTDVTFEYQYARSSEWQGISQTVTAEQSPVTVNTGINVSATISGLTCGTYNFRVKAVNNLGITYGNVFQLSIGGQVPTVTMSEVTNLGSNTVTLNGTVNAHCLLTFIFFEYGETEDFGQISSQLIEIAGDTSTSVSATITGLTNATRYYFRVKAINSLGQVYGTNMDFLTLQVPTVATLEAINLTPASVTLTGTVNANSFSSVVTFEYGTTTDYGQEVTPEQSPVTGNISTNVSVTLTDLTCGTEYHFRVKALNSIGTTYGDDETFNLGHIPILTTNTVSSITSTTAVSEGNISDDGCSAITERGFYVGLMNPPGMRKRKFQDTGTGIGIFKCKLTGLQPSTTYYVHAYARNNKGEARGNVLSFKTSP